MTSTSPFTRPLKRLLPIAAWLPNYRKSDFSGDLMAGVVVAIMLIPQGMAYAMLAGLPPQVGLYASVIPLIAYALFGSSKTLAVGPVAMVSLMVASSLSAIAVPGSPEYVGFALLLALMTGVLQLVMGVLKLGSIVNFLSHPVISGFTSAAAIVIGLSQFKHVLGVSIPGTEYPWQMARELAFSLLDTSGATLSLSLAAIAVLIAFRKALPPMLARLGVSQTWRDAVARAGPLAVVVGGTLAVYALDLHQAHGVKIVGEIPQGLPSLTSPQVSWEATQKLAPAALAIVFVGFMESVAIARTLASKRRESVEPDQELFALGAANVAASLTGGYPVTGGFSRSVVNFSAGARTGLASILTAMLIALTLLFLTPLFYLLPKAVLAAIILVAVVGLIDLKTLRLVWQYDRYDGVSLLLTFAAVFGLGVESGILIGAASAIALHLWRASRPHVAVVGRIAGSEHFRNEQRHQVETLPDVLFLRIDENLFFANARKLGDLLINAVAQRADIKHLVLVASSINHIDAGSLEVLEDTAHKLHDAGVALHISDLKGPVADRLKRVEFEKHLGDGRIFLSAQHAWEALKDA